MYISMHVHYTEGHSGTDMYIYTLHTYKQFSNSCIHRLYAIDVTARIFIQYCTRQLRSAP